MIGPHTEDETCANNIEHQDCSLYLNDDSANAHAPIQQPLNIFVQMEGRLRSFEGKGDMEDSAWCADDESALRAHNLTGRDAADYV